jgi:NAD(P)H-binding
VYANLAEMEAEIRNSATQWTIVRPPKLVNKPLTGNYRTVVGGNVPRGYAISRADVAHLMLAVLDDPATLREPNRDRVLTSRVRHSAPSHSFAAPAKHMHDRHYAVKFMPPRNFGRWSPRPCQATGPSRAR